MADKESADRLYPLGTVVKLINVPKEIVIIGYRHFVPETERVYDYIGVNAVFGMSLTDDLVLFQKDQIEEVVFPGYMNEDADDFLNALSSFI